MDRLFFRIEISCKRDIKRGGDYPGELSFRNIEWLSDYCCCNVDDPGRISLAKELCVLASSRYRQREKRSEFYYHDDNDDGIKVDPVLTPDLSDASLPLLIKAIIATECEQELSDLVRVIIQFQDYFRMEACQAPALKVIIPWVKEKLGSIPPPLSHWLDFVRKRLSLAIARKPTPPTSWARKGETCRCPVCEHVDSFMFDPTKRVFRYSGTEYTCKHIMIMYGYQDKIDVKYTIKNTGKLYQITLAKINKTYKQDVIRYKRNVQLLAELSELDK